MPKPSSPQWENRHFVHLRDAAEEVLNLYKDEWPNTLDGRAMMIAFEQRAIAYAARLSKYLLENIDRENRRYGN